MATVGTLIFEMSANVARLQSDMAKARSTVESTMSGIESAATRAKTALAGIGLTLSIGAFVSWIRGAIDLEAGMGRLAQRAGETVEVFSAMAYAFGKAGDVDAESLQRGMKKLDVEIGAAMAGGKQAQGVFRALGIEFKDGLTGSARKASDVMLDLSAVFASAPDGAIKTAYAAALMGGKIGDTMIPALNKGREELERLMKAAEDAGKVMSKDNVEAAEKFNKSLESLTSGGKKLGMAIANDLLPWLNDVTKAMILAKKESGTLMSLWVMMGGVGSAVFSDGLLTPIEKTQKEIAGINVRLNEMRSRLQNAPNAKGSFVDAMKQGAADLTLNLISANARLAQLQSADKAAREQKKDEEGKKKELDPSGLRNQNEALAEQKLFTSALQRLEKQYYSLTHAGDVALLMWETEKGSLKGLTAAHKAELITIADKIDAYNRLLTIQAQSVQNVENEGKLIEQRRLATVDYAASLRQEVSERTFQVSLIGKSAREQELMNAQRKIELDLRQRLASLPEDESAETARKAEEFRDMAQKQTAEVTKMIADRQALERTWLTGVKDGMNEYLDTVTNAAAASKQLFTDTWKGAEDGLVKFLQTGKLDVRSFVSTISADLLRIGVRENITSKLAAGSGDFFSSLAGSLFGGARAGGGDVAGGQAYLVGEKGPELVVPSSSGTVIPNNALGAGGGGGQVNVNLTVNALDSRSVLQAIAPLKGYFVSWTQQAFNQRGVSTPMG